jgi:acid phosphatase type 7
MRDAPEGSRYDDARPFKCLQSMLPTVRRLQSGNAMNTTLLPDPLRRQLLRGGLAGAGLLLLPGCNRLPGDLGTRAARAATTPRGLHVSLTGDAHSSRTVTWFTDGSAAPATVLEFDSVPAGMSAAQARALPFAFRAEGQSAPTPGVPAFTHRATAEALDPRLPMRYRVGSEAGWSEVHIVQPTPTGDWSFVHFGDHGVNHRAVQLTQEVLQQDFDLLLLAGDLSYANGTQPVWDAWFDQVEPLLATRVTMAAPGNHEEEDDGGNTFKNRFSHPPAPTAAVFGGNAGSTFYAFDYNRVHFLVTTAGALINDGTLPEELANIELDLSLAAARRAAGQIDFIVVMQHFTIWTDQEGRSPMNPSLVALEEDIIVRYGVDLLLVGHDHVYQRSVPMAFGLPNSLGYVQMMVGTGGASIRLFDEDGPQPWSARQFIGIGYARYEVSAGRIRGQFFGAPPLGLSESEREFARHSFERVDEFEIKARAPALARAFAVPPREPHTLLANFDGIARHTRERNRRHRLGLQHV